MTQKTKRQIKALDLMLLDLQTIRTDIRNEAKEYECEYELDDWKQDVINYLNNIRNELLTK